MAPIWLKRLAFSLVQLKYLLLLAFGVYSWALIIGLHQLLQLIITNTQRLGSTLYEILITFSLWLVILFELDFPSYRLPLSVVSSVIANITGKIGHRKDRIFLLMFSNLANEGLRSFRYSLILSPDATLELTAH